MVSEIFVNDIRALENEIFEAVLAGEDVEYADAYADLEGLVGFPEAEARVESIVYSVEEQRALEAAVEAAVAKRRASLAKAS